MHRSFTLYLEWHYLTVVTSLSSSWKIDLIYHALLPLLIYAIQCKDMATFSGMSASLSFLVAAFVRAAAFDAFVASCVLVLCTVPLYTEALCFAGGGSGDGGDCDAATNSAFCSVSGSVRDKLRKIYDRQLK